jgi:hypothetical protein
VILSEGAGGIRGSGGRLLAECEANDNIRWLIVACSVGRGAGDSLSDLDMGMGISDDAFELVVIEASKTIGPVRDEVVLYDPGTHVTT